MSLTTSLQQESYFSLSSGSFFKILSSSGLVVRSFLILLTVCSETLSFLATSFCILFRIITSSYISIFSSLVRWWPFFWVSAIFNNYASSFLTILKLAGNIKSIYGWNTLEGSYTASSLLFIISYIPLISSFSLSLCEKPFKTSFILAEKLSSWSVDKAKELMSLPLIYFSIYLGSKRQPPPIGILYLISFSLSCMSCLSSCILMTL